VEERTIRERFFAFLGEMDMTTSYKPVMLLALLDAADEDGRARVSEVVKRFRAFYEQRKVDGLVVEAARAALSQVGGLDDGEVQRVMLKGPFDKFGRREFIAHDRRDLAYMRFDARLWRQLKPADLERVREICREAIGTYYERLDRK
jgi:hypothetical protein